MAACEELTTFVAEKEAEGAISTDDILREVRQQQFQLNVTREYKLYICLVSVFGPHRNIAKHWDTFEPVFTTLISQEEANGQKHMLQAVIQFFVNRWPETQGSAAALCKKLYDNSIIEDTLFIGWHTKSMKLNRDCIMYDRKAESTMRPILAEFITWLSSCEYDEEEAYGEEATGEAEEEEEKKEEESNETDVERNQRLLVEAQKKAQADRLATAQAKRDAQQEEAAAAQDKKDEESRATAAANVEIAAVESATKVADIAVDDEFDINDI